MVDIEKVLRIAEESRFLSQIQEVLDTEPVYLAEGLSQLTDYLYLGGIKDALDVNNLKRLGITHVINCSGKTIDNGPLYCDEPEIWVYHALKAEDNDDYDILQHLPDVQMIIKHARDFSGKVLIHCEMGINRSCALCMGHIMMEYGADLIDVFYKIKDIRGICVVNAGFQRRLIRFARNHNLLYPVAKEDSLLMY